MQVLTAADFTIQYFPKYKIVTNTQVSDAARLD